MMPSRPLPFSVAVNRAPKPSTRRPAATSNSAGARRRINTLVRFVVISADMPARERLPAMVDGLSKPLVIEISYGLQELLAQPRQIPGRGIGLHLLDGSCPRYDGADSRLLHHPGQSRLSRSDLVTEMLGHQAAELLGCRHSGLEIHSRECLADVERFALPVEVPVVVLGELGVGGVTPAEEATGQWYPGDDSDAGLLRGRQHVVQRLAAEGVEDDLDGRRSASADGGQCLVAGFDADAVRRDCALVNQGVQGVVDLIV